MKFSRKSQVSTASTLVVTEKLKQQNKREYQTSNYLFCGQRHSSASCTRITNPVALKKIAQEKKVMFQLSKPKSSPGHTNRQCRPVKKFNRCNGMHNTLICGANVNYKIQPLQVQHQVTVSPQNKRLVSTNLYVSNDLNNNSLLLHTARAVAKNVKNSSCTLIMLD